ncbi:MAG: hypothetical protein ABWW69_05270 [Pyrodictiaceae archaeon]
MSLRGILVLVGLIVLISMYVVPYLFMANANDLRLYLFWLIASGFYLVIVLASLDKVMEE